MPHPEQPKPEQPKRGELLWRLGAAATLNVPIALIASRTLLYTIPDGTSGFGWTASLLGWVSTMAMLCLVGWILAAIPLLIYPRRWLLIALIAGGGTLAQLILVGDTVVYGLFRTHYNHMVWLALTTPGAGDSISLGLGTWFSIIVTVLLAVAAAVGITWLCLRPRTLQLRRWRVWLPASLALIALFAADKTLFVIGDLRHQADVTRIDSLFPLYQPVYMRRFAARMGWAEDEHGERINLSSESSGLRYPLEPITLRENAGPLDIVIIAVEGMRADQVNPETMPHLSAFAAESTVCTDHWSGGNATRFGLFSLFYGLHAAYWPHMLADRRGSVFFDVLNDLHYALRVDSCTDLNFPEFRQTAFAAIPDALHDEWPGNVPRVDRDRIATDNAVAFINASETPSFQFVFYDASHSIYRFPDEHAVFTPFAAEQEINFLKISKSSDAEALRPLYNRYRNALHYVDAQIGRVLDAIRAKGRMDSTIVIIVGDHGEEFGELGTFGHNGTFSRYQAGAACIAHLPGRPPGTIDRLTSHIDIVPTILERIGVTTEPSAYTQGISLDATDVTRDHLVTVSFNDLALVDDNAILVVGTAGFNPRMELLGHDYRPLPDAGPALRLRQPRVLRLMQDLRTFAK